MDNRHSSQASCAWGSSHPPVPDDSHGGSCEQGHSHPHHDGCSCEQGHSHPHDDGCSCEQGHSHPRHDGCSCEQGHSHSHDDGCGCCACGHDDGCGCGHDHGSHRESAAQKATFLAALVVGALSFLPVLEPFSPFLLVAATLLAGWRMFLEGLGGLIRLRLDELSLMVIAVVAACLLGEFREAALVTVLFRLGEMLEAKAVSRSRGAIAALTAIQPQHANLVEPDGSLRQVAPEAVPLGSRIVVKAGERVPLDAVIEDGSAVLDASAITGESLPLELKEGDRVLSGMINTAGAPVCRTVSTFADSTASRILQMVEEASARKGRTEKFITRFAAVYTPAVVAVALLLAVLPPLVAGGSWSEYISRALIFLVASCPCALVISVPLSFFAGMGAISRAGVLVKGSRYLELLAQVDRIAFDKTGTLTGGKPAVSQMIVAPGFSREEALSLARAAESRSNHPAAQAVLDFCGEGALPPVEDYREEAGYGVELTAGGRQAACGSARLMERLGVDLSALPAANLYLAVDGRGAAAFQLYDQPRPDSGQALSQLREVGVGELGMFTGDGPEAAQRTAREVGVDSYRCQLLPQDKVAQLEGLRRGSRATAFVGDGINDAPVLAAADLGIAMGLGSQAAMEAADVVLVSDRLTALPRAIRLARRAMNTARFNVVFALAIKLAVLVLGALGMAQMWMAVFADVGVTVLTVLNSTRMLLARQQ